MTRDIVKSLSTKPFSRWGVWLVRSFWAFMLVGHLPALLVSQARLYEAPPEPSSILKFTFLILSVVYFSLKLLGFRFWKIDPSWDRMVVYCLVVLLLHSGVVVDLDVPLGQSGLGWVHLISPFVVVLGGAALVVAIRHHAQRIAALVPIPINPPHLSSDRHQPSPALARRELFISSLLRRGPPTSLFR